MPSELPLLALFEPFILGGAVLLAIVGSVARGTSSTSSMVKGGVTVGEDDDDMVFSSMVADDDVSGLVPSDVEGTTVGFCFAVLLPPFGEVTIAAAIRSTSKLLEVLPAESLSSEAAEAAAVVLDWFMSSLMIDESFLDDL